MALEQVVEISEEHEIRIDDTILPIKGLVRPTSIQTMPEKIVMGDATLADQRIASEWVSSDFRGGLGIDYANMQTDQDRYWWATVNTMRNRSMSLPFGISQVQYFNGSTLEDFSPVKFFEHSDFWFCLGTTSDSHLRLMEWDSTNGYYKAAVNLTAKDFGTNISQLFDAVSTGDRVWIACTNSSLSGNQYCYYVHDATSGWLDSGDPIQDTFFDAADTANGAKYFCFFGTRLLKYDESGRVKEWDGSKWLTRVLFTMNPSKVTGFVSYFDANNTPAPYLVTTKGLFVVDPNWSRIYPTAIQLDSAHSNGKAFGVWNDGFLYYCEGLHVHRYSMSQIQTIGPNKDDGLPKDYKGYYSNLVTTPDYLVLFVNNQDASSSSNVVENFSQAVVVPSGDDIADQTAQPWMLDVMGWNCMLIYTKQGWHTLFVPPLANRPLTVGAYSTIGGNLPRLWFGFDSKCYYLRLPDATSDPIRDHSLIYRRKEDDGLDKEFFTSWFDGNMPNVKKVALAIELRVKSNKSATDLLGTSVDVFYGTDQTNAFTYLGTCSQDTNTNGDGIFTFYFNEGRGLVFDSLRLRFKLNGKADDNTLTPVVLYASTRFQRVFDNLFAYSFRVDTTKDYKGKTVRQIIAKLEELADKKELVEFAWRPVENETRKRLVRITQLGGQTTTGRKPSGFFDVVVSEAFT
jgi:hypothetical protein